MGLNHRARVSQKTPWPRRILGLFLLSLVLVAVVAQAATYVYDSNGRVRAVTSTTGASSQFVYDKLGNILSVQSVPAGQLAIFAFTPSRGPLGLTGVTINGQGFSATPASNTVKFNGSIAATVTSATTTQLVVTVPSSATTGPISVTVGTSTVTSADTFTVTTDDGGLPPTVTSFTPTLANSGSSVTVTGTHFVTTAGATQAGVDVFTSTVTPTSDTQLAFPVPAQSGSGPVTVATPYGSAQSATPLIVVPASVGAGNVVATTTLTVNGSAQTLNISTAGKYAAAVFQGATDQWLSLQFASFTTTPSGNYVGVTVYDPAGVAIASGDVGSTAYPLTLHLPPLPQSGTYTVVMNAPSSTAQFAVNVETNVVLTTASPTTVSTAAANQTKRVLFTGLAKQYLYFAATSPSTTPSGGTVSAIQFLGPIGEAMIPYPSYAFPQFYNLSPLTETGTSNVIIGSSPGTALSTQIALAANPVTAISINGSSVSQSSTVVGESTYMTFSGTAGQNVSLGLSNVTTNPSGGAETVTIYEPSGVAYTEALNFGGTGVHYPLFNLPLTGTYTMAFGPYGGSAETIAFTATLSTDVTGTLTANSPKTVNLAKPGQIARLTFTGTTGQNFGLNLSGVSTTPSGGNVTLTVYNPDGTTNYTETTHTTSSTFLNLSELSQTGTYTVQLDPDYADTASATVTLVPLPTNSITVDGSSVSQSTTYAGEETYMTFSGTAGQNLSLGLSNISTSPSAGTLSLWVYENGSLYAGPLNFNTIGTHYPLTSLPWTGTYTMVFGPYGSTAETITFTATLSSDVTGTLAMDSPFSSNLTKPGQIARLSYSGTSGNSIGLSLANVATTPAGGNVTITDYNPDGTTNYTMTTYTASTTFLNLPQLTTTGTYTVEIDADYADTSTSQLTLTTNPYTPLTVNGSAATVTTHYPGGEAAYQSFSGTAGQNMTLKMTNVATSPAGGSITYSIYEPGYLWVQGTCSLASCTQSLANLPVTGVYSIVYSVNPSSSTESVTGQVTSP